MINEMHNLAIKNSYQIFKHLLFFFFGNKTFPLNIIAEKQTAIVKAENNASYILYTMYKNKIQKKTYFRILIRHKLLMTEDENDIPFHSVIFIYLTVREEATS